METTRAAGVIDECGAIQGTDTVYDPGGLAGRLIVGSCVRDVGSLVVEELADRLGNGNGLVVIGEIVKLTTS